MSAKGKAGEGEGAEPGFGAWLSGHRTRANLTLENIADVTKLSVTHLRSLETESWSALPDRVFVVGFVKGYARCVGVPEPEALSRLERALGAAPDGARVVRGTRRPSSGPRLLVVVGLLTALAVLAAAAWTLTHR